MKPMGMTTILLLLALTATPAVAPAAQGEPVGPQPPTAASGGILFIENAGQWPPSVGSGQAPCFQVWGGGQTPWLAEDAVWLTVEERANVDALERFAPERGNVQRENAPRQAINIKLSFPGANSNPVLEPFDRLAACSRREWLPVGAKLW